MTHAYPDYLIVGLMKAATTTIYDQITRHPRAVAAKEKELHYFSRDFVRNLPAISYEYEYHELLNYDPDQPDLIYGEASPSYIAVPERIKAFNPNCKIIISLRDPVSRAISQYRQYKAHGLEDRPFEEAFKTIDASNNYVRDSLYYNRIQNFLAEFPARNVLLVSFETFVTQTQDGMDYIFRFLDLEPISIDADIRGAQTSRSEEETDRVSERLRAYFDQQSDRISSLIAGSSVNLFPDASAFARY